MTDLNFFVRILLALLLAGVVSYFTTPMVMRMAHKVGAMDVPKDDRRMHKVPIPRMGGLAIFLGFLLSVLVFLGKPERPFQGVLLGTIIIVILGVFDDKYALGAKLKLAVQLIAAAVVVFYGNLRIDKLTNPFGTSVYSSWDLGVFSYPITILWIVAITNAVNFIDGLDGLACGVSCISGLNMLVIAMLVSDAQVAVVMAALTGACLGFVPYNFNPAKIFMGDTGSTFLGFILATVSIQGLFKAYTAISFAVPFLLLGLPIFDICFSVIRRVATGHNPMEADRGHFHHRLIDMGFSQKQSVAIAYVLTGILGLAAVLLTVSGAMKALIMLGAIVVVGAIGMKLIFSGKPIHLHEHHDKAHSGEKHPPASHAPSASGQPGEKEPEPAQPEEPAPAPEAEPAPAADKKEKTDA